MAGEAQAIIQALHQRGMSDGAIGALCGLSLKTVWAIRNGSQSGRNSLATLRAIAVASMPQTFGPVELEVPTMPRAPHVSPHREASRQRARIMKGITHILAPAPPAPPVTPAMREQATRLLGSQLGIGLPASRPDGGLDTSELRARFTGAPPLNAQRIVTPAGAARVDRGPDRRLWCATCPYRPSAPDGTPEYAMQRANFSCPHFTGQDCQRPS